RITLPEDEQRMVDLRAVPGLELGERHTLRVESLGFDGATAVPVVAEMVVVNTTGAVPEVADDPEAGSEGEAASGSEGEADPEREREQAPDAEGEEAPQGEEQEDEEQEAPPEDQEGPVAPELVDGLSIVGGSPVTAPTWVLTLSGTSD